MQLTNQEKRMLSGEEGEPVRLAMEILTALGEIYGADRMVSISSAHVAGLSLKSHGTAGMEWAEEMAQKGARVKVPTTMNVIGVDRSRDLGLPRNWSEHQMRIEEAYETMGCIGLSSCVPYYCGFLPRFGQHIAWAESSAVVFTNSVLGARDNREGGPSALAAALAGRTPNYGLHIKENRRGNIYFKVSATLQSVDDYGALGAYIGKLVGSQIPVLDGPSHPTTEQLVTLGAALASSGGVAMFHMVGVTPEAPDLATACGGEACQSMKIGPAELETGREGLSAGSASEIDYVAVGCPHLSLPQLREVAELLQGKRVNGNTRMWVHTNAALRQLGKQLGYVDTIEAAGAVVTQDLCTILGNPEALGVKSLATNSPKMAFYAPGSNGLSVRYGSLAQCIGAALTGHWAPATP